MKEVEKKTCLKIYESIAELSEGDQNLISLAVEQLQHAYAPYSQFHVGSALRLANGDLFIGSNQENASYPLCMCAERVAIYNASSNQPNGVIEVIAITAKNQKKLIKEPISPCGACRQVILEFEKKQNSKIRILLKTDGSEVYEFASADDLLPFSFDSSFL